MRLNGKRPTRAQREMIEKIGLKSGNWLVAKDTPTIMLLVCRHSRQTKLIKKEWYNK